jgi:hypothetical protein
MEPLEKVFQELNKESYELKNHKENLRAVLHRRNDREEQVSYWDMRTIFASISFAAIAILSISIISPITTDRKIDEEHTLYGRLLKNTNAMKSGGASGEDAIIEVAQEGVIVTMQFNKNRVLINSNIK